MSWEVGRHPETVTTIYAINIYHHLPKFSPAFFIYVIFLVIRTFNVTSSLLVKF